MVIIVCKNNGVEINFYMENNYQRTEKIDHLVEHVNRGSLFNAVL